MQHARLGLVPLRWLRTVSPRGSAAAVAAAGLAILAAPSATAAQAAAPARTPARPAAADSAPTTNRPVDASESERATASPSKPPAARGRDRAPEELGVGGVVELTSVGEDAPAARSEVIIPTELEAGTPIPPARRSSPSAASAASASPATSPRTLSRSLGESDDAAEASGSAAVGGVAEAARPAKTLAAGANAEGTWSGQVLPTALALAGTLGAILLARAVVKRFGNRMGGGKRPSGVVEVMARYPFARGHHIVLIKVGRRVLVTHQSAQGIQTLSEFTSPAEVADLIARCEAGTRGSEQFTFDALLRGSEREFAGKEFGGRETDATATAERKAAARLRSQRPEFRSALPAAARGAEIETIDLTRRREVARS